MVEISDYDKAILIKVILNQTIYSVMSEFFEIAVKVNIDFHNLLSFL